MKKRSLLLLILFAIIITLTGCGNKKQVDEEEKIKKVSQTDYINIDGIYVDDSYVDSDNENLKIVYLFYTATTTKENLKVDSKSTLLKVNGVNEYQSSRLLVGSEKNFVSNYYHSDYLEDIYVGDSLKILETFKVPNADLESGKTLTFSNSDIPDTDKLLIFTDDIIHAESFEKIAEMADPDGYAKEVNMRSDADQATVNRVRQEINDYYWTFYVNSLSYKLEFYAPNNFDISMSGLSNSGTYYVKNGYIALSYDNGESYAVYIAYEYNENGEIELGVVDAFDVR